MNNYGDHSSIAHLLTVSTKRVVKNVKCLFLYSLLISAYLLPGLVESSQLLRTNRAANEEFSIYWNAPTFQCHRHGVMFDDITKQYGILQNKEDTFRGDQISILYDPGNFPALLKDPNSSKLKKRNGGVPQEGNLDGHLNIFKEHLEELIPDPGFNGIGVIDFESWRPIFRQNFGSLQPYKDLSYDVEKQRHPWWTKNMIEKEASKRFEESGGPYMKETLMYAKKARPSAKWGYYAYPYCFNMHVDKKNRNCADGVKEENNKIQWLWDESDLLFPSVYLNKNKFNANERLLLIKGRVAEAKRVSARTKSNPGIYPYFWYKYRDERETFLNEEDIYNGIKHMRQQGLDGVIIWGSSKDVSNTNNCLKLRKYVDDVLGPVVKGFTKTGSNRAGFNSTEVEDPPE